MYYCHHLVIASSIPGSCENNMHWFSRKERESASQGNKYSYGIWSPEDVQRLPGRNVEPITVMSPVTIYGGRDTPRTSAVKEVV